MSSDIRRDRSSSKRKGRDGPEDAAAPRKKQNRKAADSDEEEAQFDNSGSEDEMPSKSKSASKPKGKSVPREEKEYPSINELKKRIRDVKRLLNKQSLPADARIVQERALAGYEEDLAEETARRERSSMISKYHFVRFLDRKTANKQLSRLRRHEKDENLDAKKKKSLERKIHEAEVNLNYTIYYPLTEKYISLYPKSKGKSSEDAEAESETEPDNKDKKQQSEGEKPALWSVVEKCMKEETLGLLREGKLNIGADGKPVTKLAPKPVVAPAKKPKVGADKNKTKQTTKHTLKTEEESEPKFASRRERRADKRDKLGQREHQRVQGKGHHAVAPAADGDDSDGGFFE